VSKSGEWIITRRRRRGRPRKLKTLKGHLVLALDEMIEAYVQQGCTEGEARKKAFAEARSISETEDSDGHPLADAIRRKILKRAGVPEGKISFYLRPPGMSPEEALEKAGIRLGKNDSQSFRDAPRQRRLIEPDSFEREYRAECRSLRPIEMRLAEDIDRRAKEIGLEAALFEYDGGSTPNGTLKRRYRRGKRALKAARKNKK
jgi:hypothetical protein